MVSWRVDKSSFFLLSLWLLIYYYLFNQAILAKSHYLLIQYICVSCLALKCYNNVVWFHQFNIRPADTNLCCLTERCMLADWALMFQTKCYGCQFPIEPGDRWVEALSQNWHSECFNCSVSEISNRHFLLKILFFYMIKQSVVYTKRKCLISQLKTKKWYPKFPFCLWKVLLRDVFTFF